MERLLLIGRGNMIGSIIGQSYTYDELNVSLDRLSNLGKQEWLQLEQNNQTSYLKTVEAYRGIRKFISFFYKPESIRIGMVSQRLFSFLQQAKKNIEAEIKSSDPGQESIKQQKLKIKFNHTVKYLRGRFVSQKEFCDQVKNLEIETDILLEDAHKLHSTALSIFTQAQSEYKSKTAELELEIQQRIAEAEANKQEALKEAEKIRKTAEQVAEQVLEDARNRAARKIAESEQVEVQRIKQLDKREEEATRSLREVSLRIETLKDQIRVLEQQKNFEESERKKRLEVEAEKIRETAEQILENARNEAARKIAKSEQVGRQRIKQLDKREEEVTRSLQEASRKIESLKDQIRVLEQQKNFEEIERKKGLEADRVKELVMQSVATFNNLPPPEKPIQISAGLRRQEKDKNVVLICKNGEQVRVHSCILRLFPDSMFYEACAPGVHEPHSRSTGEPFDSYFKPNGEIDAEGVHTFYFKEITSHYLASTVQLLVDYLYGEGFSTTSFLQILQLFNLTMALNLPNEEIKRRLNQVLKEPDTLLNALILLYSPDSRSCFFLKDTEKFLIRYMQSKTMRLFDEERLFLLNAFKNKTFAEYLFHLLSTHVGITEGDSKHSIESRLREEESKTLWGEKTSSSMKFLMGYFYEYGIGVASNQSQAVHYYKEAADQNDEDAKIRLGICYSQGIGVEQDTKMAFSLYEKVAEQENPLGIVCLAQHYKALKTESELKKAFDLYTEVTEEVAGVRVLLGNMYRYGEGVAKNLIEAVRLLALSAEQGCATAQLHLGVMYHSGEGVPKNLIEAVRLFTLSAEQGSTWAQYNLAEAYEDGAGTPQNISSARIWYERAATQGNAWGKARLGTFYELGKGGVVRDPKKAFELYKEAADQGSSMGMGFVGECYEKGIGVDQDVEKATDYYLRAATLGSAAAKNALVRLGIT
jgi:TPR repeat protein